MSSDSLAPPVPLGGNSVLAALHDAWVVTLRNQRMVRSTIYIWVLIS